MDPTQISPDEVVLWQWRFVSLNATIVFTWLVMGILTIGSWLVTRNLTSEPDISRWQNLLEVLISGIRQQIEDVSRQEPGRYLPFIGTIFLFVALSNFLTIVPGYLAPTGSLSTTAALALCVFVAAPAYGIARQGVAGYLSHYIRPTVFMLPFHVLGELSRTLALAVRLFGNVMSGAKIVAILLGIVPLFFPVVMQALGLLTGMIHAYIFAILAMVYIASATQAQKKRTEESAKNESEE